MVLVEAPRGSADGLLAAASETAVEAGLACLRARATELERDFAYGSIRQLLEPVVARGFGPERDRLFEGAASFPKPYSTPTGATHPSSSADTAFSMLHGLYWLLNNVADERPLALAVDDVHWSDRVAALLQLPRPRLDGLPLAVLASTSGEHVTPDLARLAAGPETTVLRPGR